MRNLRRVWVWLPLALALAGLYVLFAFANRALADVAPNPEDVGSDGRNAGPTNATNVQMVSETVLMEIGSWPFSFYVEGQTALGARVTADFLFRNSETQAETLQVGFPLYLSQTPPRITFEEVWRLRAFVNGLEITTAETVISGGDWAIWDMTFPPGDTFVRVTYDFPLYAPGYASVALARYVLHTGAGWAGPIGQGDIIVRFPYLVEPTFLASGEVPTGYKVEDFDLRWHFENLEPTEDDDVGVGFVQPYYWYEVIRARQAINSERNAINYLNLARAYSVVLGQPENYIYFQSPLLAQTAEAQYLKAIELDPNNRELREELAEFVTMWEGLLLPANESLVLTQVASTPIATATSLPPTDDGDATLPPTRTPAAIVPTSTEAVTAIAQAATATPVPLINDTPIKAPTTTPASPDSSPINFTPWLLGALVIVILIGLGIALRKPAK